MAEASSHRYSSPVSGGRSPNHRTTETNCSIRRSFNGNPVARSSISSLPRGCNPVTPANSPADFPRRNSLSKEGLPAVRASYEKENERDRNLSKPIRMKSPVASAGTKNFMAPTISAASKVTPFPRKKVLTERNEIVRNSLTSPSEGKSLFPCMDSSEFKDAKEVGSKPDMGIDSQVLLDTPKALKALPQQRDVEMECYQQMDASSLPVLASSPMDQTIPPYDPETNYLSPRPKFLHYKPNPRIEVYLGREKDLDPGEYDKCLEDGFTSSCSDDTEPTEETQTPQTENESDGSSSFESRDDVKEENPSESDGVEEIPRSRSFPRPKFLSFLLVLAILCLSFSVTDSPGLLSSSVIKKQPFDKFYAPAVKLLENPFLKDSITLISKFANANLKRGVHNSKRLSIKFLAHIFNAQSLPREEHAILLQFGNVTAQVGDIRGNEISADTNPIKEGCEGETKESGLHQETEKEIGQAAYEKHVEVEEENDETAAFVLEEDVDQTAEREPMSLVHETAAIVLEEDVDQTAEREPMSLVHETAAIVLEEDVDQTAEMSLMLEEQTPAVSLAPTTEPTLTEADNIQEQFNIDSQTDISLMDGEVPENANSVTGTETNSASHGAVEYDLQMQKTLAPATDYALMENNIDLMDEEISGNAYSGTDIETSQSPETDSVIHGVIEEEFQMQKTVAISLTVLGFVVAAAVFSLPKHRKVESTAEVPETHIPIAKKMDTTTSASASSDNAPYFDRTPLNQPPEFEMLGDSGPYEVSSSLQMSSSDVPRQSERGEVEAKSNQRRGRKSSTYSYSESPSYGSFTAFEKLPSKQSIGEDEAMTPVRRSSRLRKQFTSP